MHAAIFDIDGTLLDSNGVDGELYVAGVETVVGRVRIQRIGEHINTSPTPASCMRYCRTTD